ncbi:hypothetical protein SAMN05192539_100533 [Paraburkholderia diazotrophica]|uniref:Uncharacterized protein n=1 Tax=Paraburkholderia diazotrophica TaxID=667676 RepID=A0A1H6UTY2_9BURK|nr:hypothetical protein SAMN05192539_100533 [Paraburkholderia diazotrophica]
MTAGQPREQTDGAQPEKPYLRDAHGCGPAVRMTGEAVRRRCMTDGRTTRSPLRRCAAATRSG